MNPRQIRGNPTFRAPLGHGRQRMLLAAGGLAVAIASGLVATGLLIYAPVP